MRNRIWAAYETIQLLEPEENPVKKILLVVSGHDAEVHIDEIADMDVDGNKAGPRTWTRLLREGETSTSTTDERWAGNRFLS